MNVLRILLLCAAALCSSALHAYPTKPVKVVLGFSPGGGADILLRAIVPAMAEGLGQQVLVEYRPGAGGNLAMEAVANAAPDGYTLLMGTPGLAINPSLYGNLPFDPQRDLTPVSLVGSVQNVLVVNNALPVATVSELLRYARGRADKLNYASSGTGTSLHLAAELFKASTGIDMVHVPYKGGAQAMNDVIGGQVHLMFNVLPSALPQIAGGKLKALAVTGKTRAQALPALPTMIEAGVPDYTAVTWNGILAPAATPKDIIAKLNQVIVQALRSPEVMQRLATIGQDPWASTPEEFGHLIREETAKWRKVVQASGLKAQ